MEECERHFKLRSCYPTHLLKQALLVESSVVLLAHVAAIVELTRASICTREAQRQLLATVLDTTSLCTRPVTMTEAAFAQQRTTPHPKHHKIARVWAKLQAAATATSVTRPNQPLLLLSLLRPSARLRLRCPCCRPPAAAWRSAARCV